MLISVEEVEAHRQVPFTTPEVRAQAQVCCTAVEAYVRRLPLCEHDLLDADVRLGMVMLAAALLQTTAPGTVVDSYDTVPAQVITGEIRRLLRMDGFAKPVFA